MNLLTNKSPEVEVFANEKLQRDLNGKDSLQSMIFQRLLYVFWIIVGAST